MRVSCSNDGVNQMWILKKDYRYVQTHTINISLLVELTTLLSTQHSLLKVNNQHRNHRDYTKQFSEADIITITECLIDNISTTLGGRAFSTYSRHSYGHQLCSSSRPLFHYSYETCFIHGLLKKHEKKLHRLFHFTLRYIYYVFSLIRYPWYIEPPIHGISQHLPMVF